MCKCRLGKTSTRSADMATPRHNTDFRIVFGIDIGLLVFCEIRQIYFTESKGKFYTTSCSDFKLFSAICQKENANSKPRHSTDFRTLFRITIRQFVSCEIRQTCFTESKGSIALYLMILYGIVWYILCCSEGYCMVVHGIVWYFTVLYGIAVWQLNIILWYCIVLYNIA